MPTNDDDRRVEEIQKWFAERGYDLYVHEVEGHGWRAPYMPKGSRIGSASYGTGDTPREAAEDAQARYTRDHEVDVSAKASMPWESTQGVSKTIGIAVETDTAMPITPSKSKTIGTAVETDTALPITPAKSRAIEPPIDLPELDEKVETLTTYGWRVLFEEEPDGRVTGHLVDLDSGETLKSAMGDDFPDAWLGLGIDTTPPSMELRRERDQRREGSPNSNR
ncbi:MAG TPA: hypothetical protein VMN35_05600 [Gaiellaceae bacterium]|nr:hypothetical protein [Gaiellaceae bacterium]